MVGDSACKEKWAARTPAFTTNNCGGVVKRIDFEFASYASEAVSNGHGEHLSRNTKVVENFIESESFAGIDEICEQS